MKKAQVIHTFDCDSDTYWKAFFSKEYNEKLYREGLGFKSFEVLELSETSLKLRGAPNMKLPGPVAKLLGDSFGYEQTGTLDRAGNIFRWKMVPNTMKDKLFTDGSIKLEVVGDKVRRTQTANIEAKMFGVGGLLESTAEKEMLSSWEKEAAFTARYLKENKG